MCDAHEDALLHVAKPRDLLCDKTDKDVERWLSIVITACLLVIVCAELLSFSPHANAVSLQGGEGAEDASNCTSLFAKKSPIIGLFCGKSPVQMRHPGVFTIIIIFSYWWLSYNKLFYLLATLYLSSAAHDWGWSSSLRHMVLSPISATASLCSHVDYSA